MTADQANSMDADARAAAARKPYEQEPSLARVSAPGFGSKVAHEREPIQRLLGDLADASRAEPGVLGLDRQSAEAAGRFERPDSAIRGNLASSPPSPCRQTATHFQQCHPINRNHTGRQHG